MERIPADVQLFHLFIGHLDARQILAVIQSGLDPQSGFGGGRRDQGRSPDSCSAAGRANCA